MSPGGLPPLRILFWESTAACNLACAHCRRVEPEETAGELTTAEAEDMLTSAAVLGRPLVIFSGGEPLVRNDWEHLAAVAGTRGLPTALATNGTLVDTDTAERIRAAGFGRVSVSIDGADAKTHDTLRGITGSYRRTMRGIDLLLAAGNQVQLNVTVTRRNVDQIETIYHTAVERGIHAVHLFLLVPVGCGATIGRTDQISPEQYEKLLGWVHRVNTGDSVELRATCAPHYNRIAAAKGDSAPGRGCLCGFSVIFVGHTGEVFPCGYLPVSCGSLRETPLEHIWRDAAVLADLRDRSRLKGKCGRCRFRDVCGGCRARAFAETGDYLAEEPSCSYPAHESGAD